ncbi:hypothetical protein T484DRAFT_1931916 [Baffinella frigidus]|nr:hypothetical protein T484DRAFT_1931916 [Cryptophyta sp. CCMP2293]
MTSCHPNLNSPNSPPSMVRNGRVSQHNARVSQHNAMDHHRTSTSHDTSEQEALFPSPLASRQLPRLALPPKTTGKDTGRSASNEDRHFQRRLSSADMERAEELVRAAFVFPTHSAPNPTLRFPVQFYAIGQCLAHPDGEEGWRCKCVKARVMTQSQAYAWNELGGRFKHIVRTVSAPLERTKISRRESVATEGRACSTPVPAISGPSTPSRRVCGVSAPTAGTSTPKTLASPGTALPCAPTPKAERSARSKSQTFKLRALSLFYARAAGPQRVRAQGPPGYLAPVKNGASALPQVCGNLRPHR